MDTLEQYQLMEMKCGRTFFMHLIPTSVLLLIILVVKAQGTVDQEAVRQVIENQSLSGDSLSKVEWHLFTYNIDSQPNALRQYVDSISGYYQGEQKLRIVEIANRIRLQYIKDGATLLIPSGFPQDYKAYSPYPFHYETAEHMPQLFVIDKYTQTFGAYEYGILVHWGIISAGRLNRLTPAGRYNFNWKTYYKLSNAAPKGEKWELYWVFNFHARIGLHVHQYSLPIGRAVSHGCVRIAFSDAEWNYNWAHSWVLDKKGIVLRNGTPVMVINDNPPHNRAAHWVIRDDKTVETLVRLPADFSELPLKSKGANNISWESGW